MTKRVLVVEDDEQSLSLFLEFLDLRGFDGVGAPTAAAAMAEIDRCAPHIMLTDWDLGEALSGVHVADYVRAKAPECTVVLMTGRAIDRLRQETIGHPIFAYLKKPFSLRDLSALLDDIE